MTGEPMLLNFNPYHVDEITAIIKDRLISLDEDADTLQSPSKKPSGSVPPPSVKVPLMQPAAIEIAARKIANTGDLRKALDVCRCVL